MIRMDLVGQSCIRWHIRMGIEASLEWDLSRCSLDVLHSSRNISVRSK